MLWKSIFYCVSGLGLVFFPCEVGQRLTNTFINIGDEFEQLNWYSFPTRIQRILPTILIGVQEPLAIGCFGIVSGSRVQFNKVIISLKHISFISINIFYCNFTRWSMLCTKASISLGKCTIKFEEQLNQRDC